MKATFRCSTLEQAIFMLVVAMKEGVEEVGMHLPEAQETVVRVVQPIAIKNDIVDALLPPSFFGAVGTKYLNDANKGKTLAYKLNSYPEGSAVLGRLKCIENGKECLEAQVINDSGDVRYLSFDKYDFVFLE